MSGYQISRMKKHNSDTVKIRKTIHNENRFESDNEEIVTKTPWTVAVVKGHFTGERMNDCINFAPVLKRSTFNTDKSTIGE
jgi:ketol-acid reductoisomerase